MKSLQSVWRAKSHVLDRECGAGCDVYFSDGNVVVSAEY